VAGPLCRGKQAGQAQATVSAATALQDVLGSLHDHVVSEGWLRQVGTAAGVDPATAYAAGQLAARANLGRQAERSAWPEAWDRLRSPRVSGWLA
jgi:CHAD domain-containing protein